MVSVIVIAVAVTALVLSVLVGTEVVLRALGRTSFLAAFVGSPAANPGYIYDLILIAIAALGASLGTASLLVSVIIGVRLERQQEIMFASGAAGAAVASSFARSAAAEPAQLFPQTSPLDTAVH